MEKDRTILEIKTTSFTGDNFYLDTTLTPEEIRAVILPMKIEEQEDDVIYYDNEDYTKALINAYPDDFISCFTSIEDVII